MKKIVLTTLVVFIISACGSDKLTNSKAEKIINICLDKKPIQRYGNIKTGEILIDMSGEPHRQKVKLYKKLEDEGFLTFKLTGKKSSIYKGAKFYNLTLMDKAKEYIDPSKTSGDYYMLYAYRYEVDEVIEIQETPSFNIASVKVKLKAVDITPLSILPGANLQTERIETYQFKKTDSGWKYCD